MNLNHNWISKQKCACIFYLNCLFSVLQFYFWYWWSNDWRTANGEENITNLIKNIQLMNIFFSLSIYFHVIVREREKKKSQKRDKNNNNISMTCTFVSVDFLVLVVTSIIPIMLCDNCRKSNQIPDQQLSI